MNTDTNTYGHECEINLNGECNWLSAGPGESSGQSKCLYGSGGMYAGQHPHLCATRRIVLAIRKNKASGIESIAGTAK